MLNKKSIKQYAQRLILFLHIIQTWKLNEIRKLVRVKKISTPDEWLDRKIGNNKIVFISHYNRNGKIQECIKRIIHSCITAKYNVFIISSLLSNEAIEWCQNHSVGFMIRKNQGRDFGAFQDAWLYLSKNPMFKEYTNLILLNDSVYPLENLIDTTWSKFLVGESNKVVGLTDSYQNGYHLQSYALNIPKLVINMDWWEKFWLNYPSWGGTAVAIKYGEIGLSQLIIQNNIELKAIHSIIELRSYSASEEFYNEIKSTCSEYASKLILSTILQTFNQSISKISPTHHLAIPLLIMGFPFIKRDLLEANESCCIDPLLLVGLKESWLIKSELPEYLKPKPIGYKN